MISFYPGPSRVYDDIPRYVKQAHAEGILSMNHRSDEFVALSRRTISLLKSKLKIPANYSIYFTSSATECWEIIAQSIIQHQSIHLYNGAFGEKWFDYTRKLRPEAHGIFFDREQAPEELNTIFTCGEVICITQNETSNGTQVSSRFIATIKKNNPRHLIAVDATSSMAGVALNFKAADIWFASVQKCFGLPAGLALLICSPQAVERMMMINERAHYNSAPLLHDMMLRWQTSCTPNVLGIYLLKNVLEKIPAINETDNLLTKRFDSWEQYFDSGKAIHLLVENKRVRSRTVLALKADPALVLKIKKRAKANGLLLGDGYGPFKQETFRIANFPALKEAEIGRLKKFLKAYL